MDLKKHEQALQSIRNKYAQLPTPTTPLTYPSKDYVSNNTKKPSNHDLFQTPIKTSKKVESNPKHKLQDQPNVQLVQTAAPSNQKSQQFSRQNTQPLLNMKLIFSKEKGRGFDDILAQRDKQLTERVERNRHLLSKSKEVRERESRNGSVDKNSNQQNKPAKVEIEQLRLALKDKNYVINDKTQQKKVLGIGLQPSINQIDYLSIKSAFTDKMKQNLVQNFGPKPKEPKAYPIEKEKRKIIKNNENSSKEMIKARPLKQTSLIKTPIPRPKQSSPSKIASIFQRTQQIEQRIHALLSR